MAEQLEIVELTHKRTELIKFDDWLKEQRKDWRFRLWEIVLAPVFWLERKKLNRRIYYRHRHEPGGFLTIVLADNPQESMWRLVKNVLAYAVCEEGECLDCDLLRHFAWEVLRIKEECGSGDKVS